MVQRSTILTSIEVKMKKKHWSNPITSMPNGTSYSFTRVFVSLTDPQYNGFVPTFEGFVDRLEERAALPSDRERYFMWRHFLYEDNEFWSRKIIRASNVESLLIKTNKIIEHDFLGSQFNVGLKNQLEELEGEGESDDEDTMPVGGHKDMDSFIDGMIEDLQDNDTWWFVEMEMVN